MAMATALGASGAPWLPSSSSSSSSLPFPPTAAATDARQQPLAPTENATCSLLSVCDLIHNAQDNGPIGDYYINRCSILHMVGNGCIAQTGCHQAMGDRLKAIILYIMFC
ncbi:uncharacterized protein LOC110433013 [Sorghum bicolor]|uniref:uncharacterized protein LOC110433013 n=1 Tax=Sorghum bicolor TaxID=4558 RepID=UPI000B424C63|nr:uncharacterized protein LOC110433013 [Sorghum bicolor]|eukprot:XP_021310214.1 uncharacterized protein LOC110433013 [Sorghum bicolor]